MTTTTPEEEPSLERIQSECHAMLQLLQNLQQEERTLDKQNEILAREALLCGMDTSVLEPPTAKKRKLPAKKSKEEASSAAGDEQ